METSLCAHPYAEPSPDQATACAFAAAATLLVAPITRRRPHRDVPPRSTAPLTAAVQF
jgi:hypothetical protein